MVDLAQAVRQTNSWACYDCGKCTSTCPISRSGARYSPRRHVLAANLGQALETLDRDSLNSCLTCSLCDQRCPSRVDYTQLVQLMREAAYGTGEEPECPHGGALQSVMRMMARGGTQQDRTAWLGRELKTSAAQGEVLYWTGCTMYYDAFFPELSGASLNASRAAVKLLNRLGITPVVSPEERCCGHDLLWNGDRRNFEALARHNVKLVSQSGAKTLVVSCAECYRTWKLDYGPFFEGAPPRILHIGEFLAGQVEKLAPGKRGRRKLTFQDPCRLGRHLGVYDPPRQLLSALPGIDLVEMNHHKKSAACCAGGTWSHCDRFAKQIQVQRLREARATGAEALVTACPKCRIHFACAMKDPKLSSEIVIPMKDLAEVVAEAVT